MVSFAGLHIKDWSLFRLWFPISIENAKALLESIGKEIDKSKGVILKPDFSVNGVLKNTFAALGYTKDEMIAQKLTYLANIGVYWCIAKYNWKFFSW